MDKERKDCLDQLDRIDITERDAAIKLIAKLRTDLTWKASFLRIRFRMSSSRLKSLFQLHLVLVCAIFSYVLC